MIVGYLALFVALTGSAYAATKVGSNDIRPNAVKSKHVGKDALTGKDIREASLTVVGSSLTGTIPASVTISGGSLDGTIPASSITEISSSLESSLVDKAIDKATPKSAVVSPSCSVDRGRAVVSSSLVDNHRCDIRFSSDVSSCTPVVSPRDAASGLPTGKRQHSPIVADDNPDPAAGGLQGLDDDEVSIIFDDVDTGADEDDSVPFYLVLSC